MATVLSVVEVIISVILIFLVLLHSGKDTGLSGAFGIGGGGSSFGGGSLVERNLTRWTIFFGVLWALNAIVILKHLGHDAAARRHARASSPWWPWPAAAAATEAVRSAARGCRPPVGAAPWPRRFRASPATLDPLAAQGRIAQTVTRQVYEPLIERLIGPYGQSAVQPGLALSARPSPNRTTWTVTLRLGVRFQDGTPFNAAAVLANSRRWQSDPRAAGAPSAPVRRRRAASGRGSLPARQAAAGPAAAPRLPEARDRLPSGARAAERSKGPFPAGRGRLRHRRLSACSGRPGAARAVAVRRVVGEPDRPRSRARRGDLRGRAAGRSALPPAREGAVQVADPLDAAGPTRRRGRIRCSSRSAGPSPASAWRARSGESTQPGRSQSSDRRLAHSPHRVGTARRSRAPKGVRWMLRRTVRPRRPARSSASATSGWASSTW